ncbi:MAG: TIGR00730 family Rossman fold protein [Phycisphaeraceae bacterium JB051]
MPSNIAVYCGSSKRAGQVFLDQATAVGTAIGQRGHTLVWGAGSIGLMGAVARATQAAGGKVIGVIPKAMDHVEITYQNCDELIYTDTMRQRKHIMDERSDVFVVLPGGFGTLEELIEVITHRHLSFHDKPILILNVDGFYDPMIKLFEHFVAHDFAKAKHMQAFEVLTSVDSLLSRLDEVTA